MRIQGTFTLNAQKIAVCIVHPAQTKRSCHSEQYRTAPADKAVLRVRSPEIRRSERIPGYSVVKGQNETYIFVNEYSYHVKNNSFQKIHLQKYRSQL